MRKVMMILLSVFVMTLGIGMMELGERMITAGAFSILRRRWLRSLRGCDQLVEFTRKDRLQLPPCIHCSAPRCRLAGRGHGTRRRSLVVAQSMAAEERGHSFGDRFRTLHV
jgi:hypothetical protein